MESTEGLSTTPLPSPSLRMVGRPKPGAGRSCNTACRKRKVPQLQLRLITHPCAQRKLQGTVYPKSD
jgi:hypothetical protein